MTAATTTLSLRLRDETATATLAAAIAPHVGAGFTLHLSGDLGTGKTAFTRALLRALGHQGRVRSPTFTLAEPYNLSNFDLYHFDFYRFSHQDEWRDAGFEESIGGDAAAVVEWPELAGGGLPAPDLSLTLRGTEDESSRIVELRAREGRGQACLNALVQSLRQHALDGVCCWAPSPAPPSA